MHALELPPYDSDMALEFADARGFKDWLKLVPMINVRQAHGEILDALSRLNVSPVMPIERLKMLELLREPVAMLQDENAKRYVGKPFPLPLTEDSVWLANVQLWSAMSVGYRHCWQAALRQDVMVAEHIALCGQRALRYAALALREHHQAYRAVPAERWRDLAALYRIAAEGGFAAKIVKDSLNQQTELSSCNASFIQPILLAAANPSTMPVRQILWTDRLLDRWSNQTPLLDSPPEPADRGALAFELDEPQDLRRYDPVPLGKDWRYIDIDPVGKRIKKRIKYLRAGESPAQLGLGEDYAAASAESHLISLFQEWCDTQLERSMPRHPVQRQAAPAQLALGLNAAHLAIAGVPFAQPDEKQEVRGRSIADFQLFGGQAQHLEHSDRQQKPAEPMPEPESWLLENESAQGFKLVRQEPGNRLGLGQLVSVRPRPEQPIVVGHVRWLLQGANGELNIGVRLLPGVPRPLAVRTTGVNSFSSRFCQALLLPAMPALQAPPGVLLPSGWFKAGKIIEALVDGQIKRIKLEQLIERGLDFERASFQGELG